MEGLMMRDIDIRLALRRDVDSLHGNDPDTLVIEELGLCQGVARVDVAVINGSVHGYEIKSERDTLARLPSQSEAYNRVFDYVTIVTSATHVQKIADVVPKWWGISLALRKGDAVKLVKKRSPRPNGHVDPLALAQLLWRDEVLEELLALGLAAGMKSKPRRELWKHLATSIPVDHLGAIVRRRIKQRPPDWRLHERPR
jgi:hypothetical protein